MTNTGNSAKEKMQEYQLPQELENDALELNQSVKKSADKTLFSHSKIIMTAILATLAATPAMSQSQDKTLDSKNLTLNTLDYTLINVGKYYPDMKDHVQELLKSISVKEWKEAIDSMLQETVRKAADDKQRIGGTIYVLESYVLYKKGFGDKYDSEITDATFDLMTEFDKKYDARVDAYIAKIEAKIKWQDERIKEMDASIEKSMSLFSPEQVKKNPKLRALVLETESSNKKWGTPISAHFQSLIDAAKAQ